MKDKKKKGFFELAMELTISSGKTCKELSKVKDYIDGKKKEEIENWFAVKDKNSEYCNCFLCKMCCENLPGIPLPEEIEKIAKFLKLSIKETLETYFVKGWRDIEIDGKDYNILFTYPAIKGWQNKAEDWGYPLNKDKIPCVFFKKGKCIINEVKPFECRRSFGCSKRNHYASPRDYVLLEWVKNKNNLNKEIKEFLSQMQE